MAAFLPMSEGLSPRTRGSLEAAGAYHSGGGSIPAHAGEPIAHHDCQPRSGVYPRARGGAQALDGLGLTEAGLSPRTRGSLDAWGRDGTTPGSIPAHAGEPSR